MRGRETIQILPSAGSTSDNEPLPAGDPVPVKNCIIWPRRSSEDNDRGSVIIEGFNVYLPPGSRVPKAVDKIVARGKTWEVEGVPGQFVSPSGRDKGTLVVLKRVGA